MSEPLDAAAALRGPLESLGLPVVPVAVPTGWHVGPVAAFLIPGAPVTLIDAGVDGPAARGAFEAAFAQARLTVSDLERIVVTHGHTDHYGSARWLQESSRCEVLLHSDDAARLEHADGGDADDGWLEATRRLFGPLGVSEDALRRFFGRGGRRPATPRFTTFTEDLTIPSGGGPLRIEHHPGHTPGHVWVVHEQTGVIFGGDFLLADSPTNAGMDLDASQPLGRRLMLRMYDDGLREMARRDAPVVLPAHGPPVTDHAALIARRLDKSARRTERVLQALRRRGASTALELVLTMVGERLAREPFGFISDVTGRLDVLVAQGRVSARARDDGVWLFRATDPDGREEAADG